MPAEHPGGGLVDPRSCEIRIIRVGSGPIVVRGRLAWLLLKIATQGAPLMETCDRVRTGHLDIDWNGQGEGNASVRETETEVFRRGDV